MTHITTGVEYALHCLLFLVDSDEEQPLASARDLAELQGVPADFVAKLFTKLQKAGIVAATEGVRGGFRLARAPATISVLDIVEAIDGQKPLFECRNIRSQCALFEGDTPDWATRGVCSIHAVMLEAEPKLFFVTDHYRSFPFVLARLKALSKKSLLELLEGRARQLAAMPPPKRAARKTAAAKKKVAAKKTKAGKGR